jgi:hypothetical protein
MPVIKAAWAKKVEEEEGMCILDVIKRERAFGVSDSVIADSFEIQAKCFNAAMRRLRDKGFDI